MPFISTKSSGIYISFILLLVVFIGMLTTIKPAYRFSSEAITSWTSDVDSSTFLYIIGLENRMLIKALPDDKAIPSITSTLFQVLTNVKSGDPKSLFAHVIPGFSSFENRIIVAGEGMDELMLSIESSPPLEEVLKQKDAIVDEPEEEIESSDYNGLTTGERDVVFVYNSHNRESFLPHLPGTTDPNDAHHDEVNITKVSERLAKSLQSNGIGTNVDETDIMKVLNDEGMSYGQSYEASRNVVKEVIANNKDIQYIFDIHRDSLRRKNTTTTINGEDYAQILFVIGAEFSNYEKNLALATKLHYLIQEKYPDLSKGVVTKAGAGTNGVYNQDLFENALLMEVGGVDNTLEELYRTADAIAEIFSEYYWEAEKVDGQTGGDGES